MNGEQVKVPEPHYNQYGQMECHRCGCYSDIIYPVHLRNENGSWVSLFCDRCVRPIGSDCYVMNVGRPVKRAADWRSRCEGAADTHIPVGAGEGI